MGMLLRALAVVAGVVLVALLVGPFLVPIPPLEGTVPPDQLADADSRFMQVDSLKVHYKMMGAGEPTILLMHGFAASVFTWREVMPAFAKMGTVVAYDRPAFGLTSRPMPGEWQGDNPYSSEVQARLAVEVMDRVGGQRAVLVGNSAGGAVAALTALRYPERVRALVLVDAAIYSGGGGPPWLTWVQGTPQADRLGPLLVRQITSWGKDFGRSAWHDPSRFTEEIWAGYTVPLRADNWDRALWELTRAGRGPDLAAQLSQLRVPTLVITGDDDRIVPTQQSIRLAGEIPGAKLVVIPECGHIPQEERPEAFVWAVSDFLAELP